MSSADLFRTTGLRLAPRLLLLLALAAAGCDMGDDLAPSGTDLRPPVQAGTTGPAVGQIAPGFTLPDTLGGSATLSAALAGRRAAVLYFTMWCPICDEHMSHIRNAVMPAYPDVAWFAVDYVSGSVAAARTSEIGNGYDGSGFTVLVDLGSHVLSSYAATMGTTVVIDNGGIVRMNEDYGGGSRLLSVLAALP